MGALGFMGMLVPEEWDGAGVDHVSYALAIEEVAAGDGVVLDHHERAQLGRLHARSSDSARDEQKERFLKPLAQRRAARRLLPDRAAGRLGRLRDQDPRAARRQSLGAQRDQAVHHSGSNGRPRDRLRGDRSGGRARRASAPSSCRPKTPGYTVARIEHKLGQRASDTAQIVFDDCALTPELMLGEEGEGYRIALANLEGGRIGIAAQSVGMARAAYRGGARLRQGARELRQADHRAPGGRLPPRRHGDADRGGARSWCCTRRALRDAGQPCLKEAAMAKLFASEMAEKVCSDAIQIHGGYGYLEGFPGRAHLPRRARLPDLRGDERHPAPRHQSRACKRIGTCRHRSNSASTSPARTATSPRRRSMRSRRSTSAASRGGRSCWGPCSSVGRQAADRPAAQGRLLQARLRALGRLLRRAAQAAAGLSLRAGRRQPRVLLADRPRSGARQAPSPRRSIMPGSAWAATSPRSTRSPRSPHRSASRPTS